MLILDSDHMSLLEWGTDESAVLRERLAGLATRLIRLAASIDSDVPWRV